MFELTSIGEIDIVRIKKATLKLFTELVVIIVLSDSGVDIFGVRVIQSVCVKSRSERILSSRDRKASAFLLLLPQIYDLLQFVIIQSEEVSDSQELI